MEAAMPELTLDKSPQAAEAKLDVLGFDGRIGRMRLLAWNLALSTLYMFAALIMMLIAQSSPTLGITLLATLGITYLILCIRISAQRLHDLNWSAWMLLLNLVPIANLVLGILMLLMPGTPGPNKYGPPPPANSPAVNILGWICIILMILGTLITIAAFAMGMMSSLINATNSYSL